LVSRKGKVLAIEDCEVDATILERNLARMAEFAVEFLHCDNADDVLGWLSDPTIDLVFLDYHLGASDGLAVLRSIRDGGDERPIIVLTGQGDEYVAARCIRAGADEYIVKGDVDPGTLARVIVSAEEENRRARTRRALRGEVDQLARENEKLRAMALFDELTGLATRRSFRERLRQEILRARRQGTRLSLLMLDLDHFKVINDEFGHATGDCALARAGSILRETLRRSDLAARFGGDELCALLPEADAADALRLAERARCALAEPHLVAADGRGIALTCSVGVAVLEGEPDDDASLLARADAALYEAKRTGRDRVAFQPLPEQ